MILSRPPISVSTDAQKSPNMATQAQKATTVMVTERDHLTRDPVTKRYLARYAHVSQDKGSLPGDDV